MKKIVILFLSTLFALACAKENQAPQEQAEGHKVNLQEVTLTAVQEGLDTKTYFNKSTGELTWTSNESDMAIFDGSGLQAFSHVSTEEGGHQATFSGTADVNNPNWIAVHPAMNSSWENSKVYVTFPCFQNARNGGGMLANMNTMAAKVTHNAGVLNDFTMKNIGGLIKLTVTESNIKSITVSTRGGEPLTGKAELSFDGSGNPVVTPLQYNYETFVTLLPPSGESELAAGDYFVSVFPGTMASGLLFDMEKTDGTAASVKASSSLTIARAADLEFKNFDTAASWYTPEETVLTLDFKAGWPFNETIASSGTDPISTGWASDGEKVMTYKDDNSILCYVHCAYYITNSGSLGLRIKGSAGDYLLLPSIPGKSLKKVVVKHSNADTSRPAIMTRGGNGVVTGGTAVGSAAAEDVNTWTLNGTAHNMQYRYQLTNGSTAFAYLSSLELTYTSKPVTVPVSNTITLDLRFYDASIDKGVNPFNDVDRSPKLDIWGTQVTATTPEPYVFTSGGTDYEFVFTGGKFRILKGVDKRGLGLSSCALKLPTISGYKLTNIKTALGGQAANQTDADPPVDPKNFYLSTSTAKADQIWKHNFPASTMGTLPTVDDDLTTTVAGTDYYIVAEWGWCYMQYLTLTYTEVSGGGSNPAPAPAPAQLLDGGEIEL